MSYNEPNDHHNNANEEDENGNPVHAMHEEDIDIARSVGIFLAQIEITKNLPPHIIKYYFTKDTNKTGGFLKEAVIFAIPKTGNIVVHK